jgi:DNA-binding response OmpR family regulator
VWSIDGDSETRSIDAMMVRLRDKLGPAQARLQTVRGVGHRLSLDADEAHAATRSRA